MLEAPGSHAEKHHLGGHVPAGCCACCDPGARSVANRALGAAGTQRSLSSVGVLLCKIICIINVMQNSAKGKITGMRRD